MEAGTIEKAGEDLPIPAWQPGSWYEKPAGAPSLGEWEKMLGRKYVPYTPQKGKFTKNDTIIEMKDHSLVMRIMYWNVKKNVAKQAKPGTPEYRMFLESGVDYFTQYADFQQYEREHSRSAGRREH